MRRYTSTVLFLVLAVSVSGGASAGAGPLDPDTEVTLQQVSLRGHLWVRPSGAGSVLHVAADIRPLLRGERAARPGTYVPHLRPEYRLLDLSTGSIHRGSLEFMWSDHGPHYEGTLPLAEAGEGPFELGFSFTDAALGEGLSSYRWLYRRDEVPVTESEEFGLDLTPVGLRMDLISSIDPEPTANFSDVWGYESGGVFLAILGVTTGTSFLDVTDPANPVEVARISGPTSSWRDIKTYSHYAYIVTEGGGGMQIVDLQDPLDPTLVNTWNTTFSSAHNLFIDTAEGVAYVFGASGGTRILDLTGDPENPTEIGVWSDRYVHDGYARNGKAYFSEVNNGLQEVLDATDKSNLQVLASWSTPGGVTHNCWVNDTEDVIVTTDETTGGATSVYDISDLNDVRFLGEHKPSTSTGVHNAFLDAVDDQLVHMSHYAIGVRLVDIHRPSVPVVWGYYDIYAPSDSGLTGTWGVYPYDSRGYIYGSNIQDGLYIVRYAPTGGTISGVVRDQETGTPIEDVTVTLLETAGTVQTGADGVYAFYADAGPVTLRATRLGYVSQNLAAPEMQVGGRVDVDVSLQKLPVHRISGTVARSDTLAPVEDARVRLEGTAFDTTTDASGFYEFLDVPVGGRVVLLEKFGFNPVSRRVVLFGSDLTVDVVLDPSVFADDGEVDLGWQVGQPADTAERGQWFLADPNGTGNNGSVQPEDDHTPDPGVQAFHTGPSPFGSGVELNDVDGGFTTLVSPTIDATGLGEVEVSYWRWLSRNAGSLAGGNLLVQVSNDGGGSWSTLENLQVQANSWTESRFDVRQLVPLTSQMQFRFRADSGPNDNTQSVTEAAVDDFDLRRACSAALHASIADSDLDDVTDGCDACPFDGLNDGDGDGVCGNVDNAPRHANPGQEDQDGDGVGDAGDNCLATPNGDQRDLDGDGTGNACDDDVDGDGTLNGSDDDDDDDGVLDGSDNCAFARNPAQEDRDSDGIGDACDFDDGLVTGVRLWGDHEITWEIEQGADSYNVYRGELGAPQLLPLASCFVTGLTTPSAVDLSLPQLGDGFSYLVTRVSGGTEGPLGEDSSGAPRTIDDLCP